MSDTAAFFVLMAMIIIGVVMITGEPSIAEAIAVRIGGGW